MEMGRIPVQNCQDKSGSCKGSEKLSSNKSTRATEMFVTMGEIIGGAFGHATKKQRLIKENPESRHRPTPCDCKYFRQLTYSRRQSASHPPRTFCGARQLDIENSH